VFVGECRIDTDPQLGRIAILRIKNSGQTPAHKLTTRSAARQYLGNEIRRFDPPAAAPHISQVDLSSGAEALHVVPLATILNENGATALGEGRLELYVWGEVRYLDAFKRRQVTEFRFMLGGHHHWPQDNRFVVCAESNNAT
jgi:hypothetical protein